MFWASLKWLYHLWNRMLIFFTGFQCDIAPMLGYAMKKNWLFIFWSSDSFCLIASHICMKTYNLCTPILFKNMQCPQIGGSTPFVNKIWNLIFFSLFLILVNWMSMKAQTGLWVCIVTSIRSCIYIHMDGVPISLSLSSGWARLAPIVILLWGDRHTSTANLLPFPVLKNAGTHLFTWVEWSNYGKVSYSAVFEPATFGLRVCIPWSQKNKFKTQSENLVRAFTHARSSIQPLCKWLRNKQNEHSV